MSDIRPSTDENDRVDLARVAVLARALDRVTWHLVDGLELRVAIWSLLAKCDDCPNLARRSLVELLDHVISELHRWVEPGNAQTAVLFVLCDEVEHVRGGHPGRDWRSDDTEALCLALATLDAARLLTSLGALEEAADRLAEAIEHGDEAGDQSRWTRLVVHELVVIRDEGLGDLASVLVELFTRA